MNNALLTLNAYLNNTMFRQAQCKYTFILLSNKTKRDDY